MTKPSGAVNRSTIAKMRDRYYGAWSRPWPHSDEYLVELWREARNLHQFGTLRISYAEAIKHCLTLMRECHPFEMTATS